MAEETATSNKKLKGDGTIWAVFIILCLISIVEVFSASSNLTYKTSNYWGPVIKHTLLLGVGVVFMVATMNIKCKYFKIVTPFALLGSFLALIVCFFMGAVNDGHRWIPIPGTGLQFQPSEIAKGAVVMATAQILSAMQTPNGVDKDAFRFIFWICCVFLTLIGLENLSTAMLLGIVVVLMMWIGKVPKRQLGKLFGGVAVLVVFAISAIMVFGTDKNDTEAVSPKMSMVDSSLKKDAVQKKESKGIFHRLDTWKSRIDKFLTHKQVPPEEFDLNNEAQVGYSNIAIASSNMVGKGPGNSTARDYLPQAFSDFIYAIIVEETGVVGAFIVCLLYIIILFRTAAIANRCVNTFPALLIIGFSLLLVTQALFNMMVAVGLAPVTGQPLPLISKGGTSSIVNCVYIGVILSVSYSAKKKDNTNDENTRPAKKKITAIDALKKVNAADGMKPATATVAAN